MPGLVSELIADIKIKGQLQADATVLSNADILAIANKELQSVIVPKILSVRENYFWCFREYQLGGGQKAYRIPPRAVGAKITAVTIRENTGKIFSLARKHPGDLSSRVGYKIVGDSIWVANVNGDVPTGVLRIEYQCAPPTMVLSPTIALGTVSSVTSSQINTTSLGTGSYEVIRAGGSQTTVCFITGSVNIFTNPDDLSSETYQGLVAAGDEIIDVNATHRVPLPVELHDWLAQRSVMRIKEYLGHSDEMNLAGAKLADMERDGLALITPRAEQDEKVISDKEILNWRTW